MIRFVEKQHCYRTQVVEEFIDRETVHTRTTARDKGLCFLIVLPFLGGEEASKRYSKVTNLSFADSKALSGSVARGSTHRAIVSLDNIRAIFSTIEIVVATDMELLEGIQARITTWHPNQTIGDIFIKMAAFMKVYTNYVKNFNNALSAIQVSKFPFAFFPNLISRNEQLQLLSSQQNKTNDPKFVEFCDEAFKHMDSDAVDLPTYLVTPVQRIPRYSSINQNRINK